MLDQNRNDRCEAQQLLLHHALHCLKFSTVSALKTDLGADCAAALMRLLALQPVEFYRTAHPGLTSCSAHRSIPFSRFTPTQVRLCARGSNVEIPLQNNTYNVKTYTLEFWTKQWVSFAVHVCPWRLHSAASLIMTAGS